MKKLPTLRGRLVINVFYESSTRTSSSFELAAKRLSADTMSIKASGSSVDKGESLKDTAITLGAYDPDVIVLRHPQIGAPDLVARVTNAHIVNAGDGKHQHPTQALLDLYTIKQELGRIEGLHVAIVGDVLHSRVARSNIQALALMGAHVTLVGPPPLIPRGIEAMGCEVSYDIDTIKARRRRLRPAHAARADAGGRELRAEPARVHRALGRHARADPAGPADHAPGPDEPRRRDRPARRRRRRRADRDAGPRRPRRRGWRCSTTCSPTARPASRRPTCTRWESPDAVREERQPGTTSSSAARASSTRRRASTRSSTCGSTRARSPRSAPGSTRTSTASSRRTGCCSSPAFVDPHVHLRTPGREDEENLATGTAAAAAGGYCAILAMPNTDPVVDSASVLGSLIEAAQAQAEIPVGFLAAITKGQAGSELTEMGELADAGAAGFTDDGMPVVAPGADAARAPVPRDHRPPARACTARSRRSRARARCTRARSRPSSASPATRRSRRA